MRRRERGREGRTGVVKCPDEADARRCGGTERSLLADVGKDRDGVRDPCGKVGPARSGHGPRLEEKKERVSAPAPPARHSTDSYSSAGSAVSAQRRDQDLGEREREKEENVVDAPKGPSTATMSSTSSCPLAVIFLRMC